MCAENVLKLTYLTQQQLHCWTTCVSDGVGHVDGLFLCALVIPYRLHSAT